ncbi:hypothetical protein Tco_0578089 [Tanacetum coccineum]
MASFLHQTPAVEKVKFPLLYSIYVGSQNQNIRESLSIEEDDIEEMDINWNWSFFLFAKHEVKTEEREKLLEGIYVEEPVPKALMAIDWPLEWNEATWLMKMEKNMHLWQMIDNKIESLKNELEELKKEKESIDHKLAGFGNASKDLNDLLESQKSAKDKWCYIDCKGYWDSGALDTMMAKHILLSELYANQAMKDNVSSLRFIALPNWFHDAHMETSNDSMRNSKANDDPQKEQDGTADVSESSGNTNPTASSKDFLADQVEPVLSPTVESEVPTVSSPVPTVSTNVLDSESPELPTILIVETVVPTGNVMRDFFGDTTSLTEVEADISNMETDIQVVQPLISELRNDHPKSQIIGPIGTPVQTRHKAKNVEEQSFIATIHQKTNLDLLQYCLFSCFLSQEDPRNIVDVSPKDER